jgi:hypothetical protein
MGHKRPIRHDYRAAAVTHAHPTPDTSGNARPGEACQSTTDLRWRWRCTPCRQLLPTSAARMAINARGTPRIEAVKQEHRRVNQGHRGDEPRPYAGVRGECVPREHPHAQHGPYPSHPRICTEVAGMRSSHASKVGRNRAAQYHRTMNPAPLRLRKAPERVWRLRKTPPEQVYAHLLTVARPTAPVIARDCCQDCCQRGNRFWTPSRRAQNSAPGKR